ncbi:MAG: hypothetical protein ACRC2O_04760 [Chitinophagaceae bacterium]
MVKMICNTHLLKRPYYLLVIAVRVAILLQKKTFGKLQYLQDKTLSSEAQSVLAEGKKLWQSYFMHTDERNVRDELKLNRADVGWYQIRKALQARNKMVILHP